MKTIFSLLLFIAIWSVPSVFSFKTTNVGGPAKTDNHAPCWAEAHYYGQAVNDEGELIQGCYIVLVLVKCKFDEKEPAPDLLAWGFVAVGDCPRGIVISDEVFHSSEGIAVGHSTRHNVSNQDNLRAYLAEHPHMKTVVADAAVEAIPK